MGLEVDFRKLNTSVRAQQANSTEAELNYMVKEIPEMEQACNFTGNCAHDISHVRYIAEFMLNSTEHGNWNMTTEGLMRMEEAIGHSRRDCGHHPQPPHPSECKEAEERMEEVLQALDLSVSDKFQDGVEHFSQQLEHEVYYIERACSVMEQCKADWDKVEKISRVVFYESEHADWTKTDEAW